MDRIVPNSKSRLDHFDTKIKITYFELDCNLMSIYYCVPSIVGRNCYRYESTSYPDNHSKRISSEFLIFTEEASSESRNLENTTFPYVPPARVVEDDMKNYHIQLENGRIKHCVTGSLKLKRRPNIDRTIIMIILSTKKYCNIFNDWFGRWFSSVMLALMHVTSAWMCQVSIPIRNQALVHLHHHLTCPA